jgi:hypothetical protein
MQSEKLKTSYFERLSRKIYSYTTIINLCWIVIVNCQVQVLLFLDNMVLANQNAKLTGPDQGFLVSPLVLTRKPWERGCIAQWPYPKTKYNYAGEHYPGERMDVTLRFLTTGEIFKSLEYNFRISRTAISHIVIETCKPNHLKIPCSTNDFEYWIWWPWVLFFHQIGCLFNVFL